MKKRGIVSGIIFFVLAVVTGVTVAFNDVKMQADAGSAATILFWVVLFLGVYLVNWFVLNHNQLYD